MAFVLAMFVHATIAWYPFEFDPPRRVDNGVTRLDDGGLAFAGDHVHAQAHAPTRLAEDPSATVATLDLEVQTGRTDQRGPARIFALSRDTTHANLVVAQDGSDLVVRVRRDASDTHGRPALRAPGVFADDEPIQVRVAITESAVELLASGHEPVVASTGGAAVTTWDPAHRVALGDDPGGDRTWHGAITAATLTVGDEQTDYLAPGTLDIPGQVWDVPERLHESLGVSSSSAAWRSPLHLLAFVPVGMLLVAVREHAPRLRRVAGDAALIGLLLQAGKIVAGWRHPSLLTVGAQVLGAVAGVALLELARRRVARHRGGATRP